MDKDELKKKVEKEQVEVDALKEKREKIDKQIREKSEKIGKWKGQISDFEMKEFEANLANSGMSLDELKQAINNGDLSDIQEKLKNRNNGNHQF